MEKKLNDATETMRPYISIVEAAKLLGVKPKTLRNWKALGKLSAKHGLRKIGRRVMFDTEELKNAVDQGELAA
jgi:excisionase family DNA binding protein